MDSNLLVQHIEKYNAKMLNEPKDDIDDYDMHILTMYVSFVENILPISYDEFRNYIITEYN